MPKGYPKNGVKRKANPANCCAICRHPERVRIESLHCAGVSLERLAEKFDVHKDAVWRHVRNHMTDHQRASYLIGPAKIAALAEVAAEESEFDPRLFEHLAFEPFCVAGQVRGGGRPLRGEHVVGAGDGGLARDWQAYGPDQQFCQFDGYQRPKQLDDPEQRSVRRSTKRLVASLRGPS